MAKKVSSRNRCRFCADATGSGHFCDQECEDDFYEYGNIEISSLWVKKTLMYTKCPDRDTEIKKFAKRHSFSLRLLVKKLKDKHGVSRCTGELN